MKRILGTAFVALLALSLISMAAQADFTLGFENITANNVGDAAIGEAQLTVDVIDIGGGQVLFEFSNVGPESCSITDVYWDDGSLLGIASLIDADDGVGGDPGVDFSPLASPANLPGGNNAVPPFVVTSGFSADSDSPIFANGVNPGELLGVVYNISGTFTDVENEFSNRTVRIGIHVQGFDTGGSEGFVNDGTNGTIPEPGTLLLLGSGLVGLAGYGKLRFRRKKK